MPDDAPVMMATLSVRLVMGTSFGVEAKG